MLIDIPAVADTAGTVTSVTWSSSRRYAYTGDLRIPGRFVSGTFVDAEGILTGIGGLSSPTGIITGNQSSGNFLLLNTFEGTPPPVGTNITGDSSSAVFEVSGPPVLPPNFFIYIDPPSSAVPYIYPNSNQVYFLDADGDPSVAINPVIEIIDRHHPIQGSAIKFLFPILPAFTVPAWAKSFTVQNISGADMFLRRYAPNVYGNVIDTNALTHSDPDATITGRLIPANGGTASFLHGDFTPCSSYAICATAAAAAGCIVDFSS